jgi:hypothetical protein
MKYIKLSYFVFLAIILQACTGIGVYHVSEKSLPTGDGIYFLKPDGTYDDFNSGYRDGRSPDVAPDGALVFIKPVAVSVGEPVYQQVWRENVLLTRTPGNKRYPRWGNRWFAYEHDTDSGKKIVVHSHNNLTIFELRPNVDGGLDFFDNGNKIVFTRDDGIYWIPVDESAVETRIASCGPPPSRCRFPVVSHDGALLAYRVTVALASGWIESIQIMRTGTWDPVSIVTLQPPANLRGVYSFDFSPDDSRLYVSARATDVTDNDDHNRLELFSIKLDGSDQVRVTNNQIADYYPSTIEVTWP